LVQESRLFGKRFPIHPKDGNTLCVYPDKVPYLRTFFGPLPRVWAARRWLANVEVSWYKILSEEGLPSFFVEETD
jgi:hypothetical protein